MANIPSFIDVQGGPITLAFSKKGRTFFSERITGNIWEIIGEGDYRLIKHLKVVQATGSHETGVLGIALDPNFEENDYVYTYYTEGSDINHSFNKIIRFSVETGYEETLLSKIPAGRIHNGGIITFALDGKLLVGVGISNELKDKSQDINYLGGKILRLNPDGSIPDDNPFSSSPVYSFGHRNIFGLAVHPKSGNLYTCDVGPDSDDEINIIKSGGNYGWPIVVGFSKDTDYINPIQSYTPTITPTQSVFYDNDLYFGSYNEGTVHKLALSVDGSEVILDSVVYQGKPFGVTGIFVSPDKEFFVTTTNQIIKIKLSK